MGPATWTDELQVEPPSGEETKLTKSWQVASVHEEEGKVWYKSPSRGGTSGRPRSTPRPGRKCSTVLVGRSMGTLLGADQAFPSSEELMTMSFRRQLVRNRQSCHATYTVPSAATSAEGS